MAAGTPLKAGLCVCLAAACLATAARATLCMRPCLCPLLLHIFCRVSRRRHPAALRVLQSFPASPTARLLQDNHPQAEVTVLELSPFYLQQGRENMAEWVRLKDPDGRRPPSVFVQAAAEIMGASDAIYDAVRPMPCMAASCGAAAESTGARLPHELHGTSQHEQIRTWAHLTPPMVL